MAKISAAITYKTYKKLQKMLSAKSGTKLMHSVNHLRIFIKEDM